MFFFYICMYVTTYQLPPYNSWFCCNPCLYINAAPLLQTIALPLSINPCRFLPIVSHT